MTGDAPAMIQPTTQKRQWTAIFSFPAAINHNPAFLILSPADPPLFRPLQPQMFVTDIYALGKSRRLLLRFPGLLIRYPAICSAFPAFCSDPPDIPAGNIPPRRSQLPPLSVSIHRTRA